MLLRNEWFKAVLKSNSQVSNGFLKLFALTISTKLKSFCDYSLSVSQSVYSFICLLFSRPTVKWLGKPAAERKVPDSNPGMAWMSSPHQWLLSKAGRWKEPGSFLGRACRPSRSEFSVVFSETLVNTG